ncbi:hypothetical protein TNCV_565661 [Trichonephila clavipes]|nr:hypothetical protein TNCV_565661 [Trichonephila clavipes]
MIPILKDSFISYYSILIHHDIFTTFFEKYVLTCNVGTRIKVYGEIEEELPEFLEFERIENGFLCNAEYNSEDRDYFISKYVSEETGWRMTNDVWCDMIYHGFTSPIPTLVIHTLKSSVCIRICNEMREECFQKVFQQLRICK